MPHSSNARTNRSLNMNSRIPLPKWKILFLPLPQQYQYSNLYIFFDTILPKLKLSEFHRDPLEWPKWSSLLTATIHNAPIDDNAKLSHLKTLVEGKHKAAIAGLGYSGVMSNAAWNASVTNFGRPQSIVDAQMKQYHLSPFIKSHDSAAFIKYFN